MNVPNSLLRSVYLGASAVIACLLMASEHRNAVAAKKLLSCSDSL